MRAASRRRLWRTIRQRQRRASAGQVSAIVTIFALLLLVSFIANFVLLQLPSQEQELEYQHLLQVENQLSRLQATILAQARSPGFPIPVTSPVTLSAEPDPPFGVVATGSILSEPTIAHSVTSYTLARVVPHPPQWENGSSCLGPTGGHCTNGGPIFFWNETFQSNSTITMKVDSNYKSLQYNISASNDTINIDFTGGDTGFIAFIINGSNDIVNLNKGGSDVNSPVLSFLFFGQNDIFNADYSGSHSGNGSDFVFVQFVGTIQLLCPWGNLSASDRIGTVAGTANNINMTVAWWNNVGYVSAPHEIPLKFGTNDTISFQNLTGFVQCPFTKAFVSTFNTQFLGGFLVQLNNRYLPETEIAYDQGAVIALPAGGRPVMVSPPALTVLKLTAGISLGLTLVDVLGNISSVSGVGTTSITTRVIGTQTLVLSNLAGSNIFLTAPFFNVSTAYPQAWIGWFNAHPLAFPSGAACSSPVTIAAPYSCTDPPPGVVVTLSAPLLAAVLTLTTVTVDLNVG